jgi:hypothetical protein
MTHNNTSSSTNEDSLKTEWTVGQVVQESWKKNVLAFLKKLSTTSRLCVQLDLHWNLALYTA